MRTLVACIVFGIVAICHADALTPEVRLYFEQIDRLNSECVAHGKKPEVKRTVVPVRPVRPRAEHQLATRRHQGIPSLAVAPNGRMWCTWYGGPTPGEDANNYVILATSADGGANWKEVLVADPDGAGPRRSFDPEIWLAPDGKLRWTWTDRLAPLFDPNNSDNYTGCKASPMQDQLWMCILNAEEEPTGPAPLPRLIARGVMLGKPCVTDKGEQIWPVAHWNEHPSSCFYISRDGLGFAWRGGVSYADELSFDEHQVVSLGAGKLHAYTRLGGSRERPLNIGEAVSCDAGHTWTSGKSGAIPHVSARFFVTRLASGNMLLVKHGSLKKENLSLERKDLTAYLSSDNGKSWKGGLPLDERRGVSYPDGQQLPDGRIVITYDRNRAVDLDILMAEFTEDDVLAGRDVSGRVRLRQRISGRALAKP